MQEAKISIIVPVYNVEPYLRKCLDSIIHQTYQNLEIILVDDGSPDNCGAICDEYAAGDQRIKVIHKINGGVSSARNAGLEAATGDWIGWVDPDDYIASDMYEYLLEGAQKYGADITVCGRTEVYPDRQVSIGWGRETVLGREEAIGLLLEDGMLRNYLWDKLWRKELFQDIEFPRGRNFEDIATIYRLFEKVDMIVCFPQCKYFYLQRMNGIVQSRSLSNVAVCYEIEKERYLNLKDNYPQFQEQMEVRLVSSVANIWGVYLLNPREVRKQYQEKLKKMAAFVREHPSAVTAAAQTQGIAGKLKLKLIPYPHWWAFALVWSIDKLYELKHGRLL